MTQINEREHIEESVQEMVEFNVENQPRNEGREEHSEEDPENQNEGTDEQSGNDSEDCQGDPIPKPSWIKSLFKTLCFFPLRTIVATGTFFGNMAYGLFRLGSRLRFEQVNEMEIEEYKKRLKDITHFSDVCRARFDATLEQQERKVKKLKDEIKEQEEKVKRLNDGMDELREKHDEKVAKLEDKIAKLYGENDALLEKLRTAKEKNIDIDEDRKRLKNELEGLRSTQIQE